MISFRCENCRTDNTFVKVDEDGNVECIECGHTVHCGVYLGPDWEGELAAIIGGDRTDAEVKEILGERDYDGPNTAGPHQGR